MPERIPPPVLEVDRHDGDWIKRGRLDLPSVGSVDELRAHLDAIGMTVAHFKKQEAYKANVGKLRWLAEL